MYNEHNYYTSTNKAVGNENQGYQKNQMKNIINQSEKEIKVPKFQL